MNLSQVDIEEVYEVLTKYITSIKNIFKRSNEYLENELGPVSAFLPEDR